MDELKPCRNANGTYAKKHGMYGTRLYHIWNGLMGRCNNANNKDYKNYGGRGISVYEKWKVPNEFFEWALSNGYTDGLSLDRIDVNGDYSPDNCRWISMKKQQRNKRNNRVIEFNGEAHCIAEWAEIVGIPRQTIISRLRHGWTPVEIFTIPPSHAVTMRRRQEAIEAWNRRASDG